jgi:putative ABC transport system permease protein
MRMQTLRIFRKQPGFAAIVMATLAVGIGASTAVFSLLNAVALRPFAFADPDRLIHLSTPNRNLPEVPPEVIGPSAADFYDWQQQARSFSDLALFEQASFNVAAGNAASSNAASSNAASGSAASGNVASGNVASAGAPSDASAQRAGGARVSGSFFSTLGVHAAWGRTLDARDDEPGRGDVAIISHALWQSAFGGDAAILQRTLTLDARAYRIVGVMPPGWRYPRGGDLGKTSLGDAPTDVWVPLALTPRQRAEREPSNYSAIGRLADGVSVAQARAEMTTIMTRLDALHSAELRGWSAYLRSSVDALLTDVRPLLWVMIGAVSLVLLIACSNAAHLLLTRAAGRTAEMGVRAALGASQSRLIRQTLSEAMLLSIGGGVIGVVLAFVIVRGLLLLDPGNVPRFDATSIDIRVLAFSVGLSLLTGLIFGLMPAVAASRIDVADLLRTGGQGRATASSSRLRRGLIVGQIALAVILLVGAGLLMRSWLELQRIDPGFSPATTAMRVTLDGRYARPEQRLAFYRNLLDRAQRAPGARQAGLVDALPFSRSERMGFVEIEGYPNRDGQLLHSRSIAGAYFDAMGTPLVDGRTFNDADDVAGRPGVAIVNQAFVTTYLRGRAALGARLRFPSGGGRPTPWFTIVGVVADVRHSNLEDAPPPQVYQSLWQTDAGSVYLAVRGSLTPDAANDADDASRSALIAGIRRAVRDLDPALAVGEARTMEGLVGEAGARRRFQTLLLGVLAGIALLLAAAGLYSVMAYSVKLRTAEIGIRLALGAPRAAVLRLVLGQGARLTLIGLALGAAAALGLTRLIAASLYRISPVDPLTFLGAAALLAGAALVACYVPAGRAARVDPLIVLRRGQ